MKRKLLFGMTVLFMIIAVMFVGCPDEKPVTVDEVTIDDPIDPSAPIINSNQDDPDATLEDDSIVLTVTVRDEGEVLSYQWYVNKENNTTTGTKINGATSKSYDPPTDELGTFYYYVVVTFKDNTKKASQAFRVQVILNSGINAASPFITTQPEREAKYATDDIALPLRVAATVSDSGQMTYQWYKSNADNTSTGTAIPDAKSTSYIPSTVTAGTTYYYVGITNTIADNGDNGKKSRTTISATAKIIVEQGAKAPRITTQPEGKLYTWGETARSLVVAANSPDGGVLTYQWYKSETDDIDIDIGQRLEGATQTTYLPDVSANKSLWYYYCEITNTIQVNGLPSTKSAKSNPAQIGVGLTAVKLGGLSVESKTYNGSRDATITGTPTLTPAPVGDVTLARGGGQFAHADVGTGIAVKLVGWTLVGRDSSGYLLDLPTNLTGTITKAAGSDVTAPVLDDSNILNLTSYKITVKAVDLVTDTEQSTEYAIDTTNNKAAAALTWKDSRTFTGLTVSTGYYIYARSKESANYQTGGYNVSENKITTIPGSDVTEVTVNGTPTDSVLTVNAPALVTATGQTIEYAISRLSTGEQLSAYQNSNTFTGLDGGTNYYVYARSKAVPGEWSAGAYNRSSAIRTADPIIRFNTDGAGSIEPRTIARGTKLAQGSIAPITKQGYDFDYWYKDADFRKPYNFDDLVNSSFTLYAKWVSVSEKFSEAQKNFVYISGGWFTQGSALISDAAPHSIGISGFWMSRYEVTQGEWTAAFGSTQSGNQAVIPSEDGTPSKLPNEMCSWYNILMYCNGMSIRDGFIPVYSINNKTNPASWPAIGSLNWEEAWRNVVMVEGADGYRLPTEAEWEYACRAGTTQEYNTGSDTINDDTGWYSGNSGNKTHKIGLKPVNAWGLFDMHGNVAELCWDWYAPWYPASMNNGSYNPTGPVYGVPNHGGSNGLYETRVVRGGSWNDSAASLRSASRYYANPLHNFNNIGFRLVRSSY